MASDQWLEHPATSAFIQTHWHVASSSCYSLCGGGSGYLVSPISVRCAHGLHCQQNWCPQITWPRSWEVASCCGQSCPLSTALRMPSNACCHSWPSTRWPVVTYERTIACTANGCLWAVHGAFRDFDELVAQWAHGLWFSPWSLDGGCAGLSGWQTAVGSPHCPVLYWHGWSPSPWEAEHYTQ